jgi:hypothetical protein
MSGFVEDYVGNWVASCHAFAASLVGRHEGDERRKERESAADQEGALEAGRECEWQVVACLADVVSAARRDRGQGGESERPERSSL